MKKPEIKRRKRVVPANSSSYDQNSPYMSDLLDDEQMMQQGSASPSALIAQMQEPFDTESLAGDPPQRMNGGPIPVDFTDTFRQRNNFEQHYVEQSVPRKRSFSASVNGDAVYAHAQNAPGSGNENIDPSLPTKSTPSSSSKEQRRVELQREAERMRQMLLEKEKELAELGDEA